MLLRLRPPQLQTNGVVRVIVVNEDGGTPAANLLDHYEIRATTNLFNNLSNWTVLPNGLVLTNGRVQFEDATTTLGSRYYITREKP